MQPAGEGLLRQKFELLKAKFQLKVCSNQQCQKTTFPPLRIGGVIASKSRYTLHDICMCKTSRSSLPVIIYPTAVRAMTRRAIVRAINWRISAMSATC
ncbi:hypothetical protein ACNKHW_15925 [Shigella flexneri]